MRHSITDMRVATDGTVLGYSDLETGLEFAVAIKTINLHQIGRPPQVLNTR